MPTPSPLRVLRLPGYPKLLTAGIVSTFGGSLGGLCLTWLVFSETRSAVDLAYLNTAGTLVWAALSLPAGTIVDRVDRRRLMVWMDLARAMACIGIGAFLLLDGFSLLECILLLAVLSAGQLTFNIAEQSILPNLVSGEAMATANGLIRSSRVAAGFSGAAVAGVMILALGATYGILTNAATFGISALLIALIGFAPRPSAGPALPGNPPTPSFLQDTREGFRWLLASPGLLMLTISALFLNFFFALWSSYLVVYTSDLLHGSALTFGLLAGLLGIGDVIGSLVVARGGAVARTGAAWLLGAGPLAGGAVIGLVIFPNGVVAALLCIVVGVGEGFAVTAWLTGAQILVPEAMRGRYFGVDALGSAAVVPVATLLGGFLIAGYGVTSTFLLAGIGSAVVGAAFAASPALRNLRADPPEAPPSAGPPGAPLSSG